MIATENQVQTSMRRVASDAARYVPAVTLWLWTFAAGSVALGAILFESHTNRVLLNRYSPPWFAFVCLSLLGFSALATTACWKTARAPKALPAPGVAAWEYGLLLGAAAASWGASLVTQYLVEPHHLDRLLNGEFMGATQTAGVLLEYLAQILVGLVIILFFATRAFQARETRPGLSRALIALSALIVAYLVAEGGVRTINFVWPRTQGVPTKPTRIWGQRYGHLNRLGFRSGEFEQRRDPNELRVLVLGDSFTYGVGIADPRHRFTEVLAARLNATPAMGRVRVFNAGVPDTNSADHLRLLDELLWLDPDLVLLTYVFNDIEHVWQRPRSPIFDPPSYLARFSLHRLLMLNSHLFDQLLFRYEFAVGGAVDTSLSAYADANLLRRHLDVLEEILERANMAGVTFRLIPFDVAVRKGPPYEERYRQFVHACRERQIPVWQMDRLFDGLSYEALIVNGWDHHPNEGAHRVVGEFLADQILSEKSVVSLH